MWYLEGGKFFHLNIHTYVQGVMWWCLNCDQVICLRHMTITGIHFFSLTVGDIKLHLKSLPSISKEVISTYFEFQGNDVEVKSIEIIGADEATILLSGLSDDGNNLAASLLYISGWLSLAHRQSWVIGKCA